MPNPRGYRLVDEDRQDEFARVLAVERANGRDVYNRAHYRLKRSGPFVSLLGMEASGEHAVWYSPEYEFVSLAAIDQLKRTGAGERGEEGEDALKEAAGRMELAWNHPNYYADVDELEGR